VLFVMLLLVVAGLVLKLHHWVGSSSYRRPMPFS